MTRLVSTNTRNGQMGINKESDISASLQIGVTDIGMVRIYVETSNEDQIPLDFTSEEAEEIAEELIAAARAASRKLPKQDM